MSLVLDALKKLERDKSDGGSAVVVVGAVPWHGVRGRRRPVLFALATLLLVAVGLGVGLLRRPARATTPAAAHEGAGAPAPAARPAPPSAAASPPGAPGAHGLGVTPPSPHALAVPAQAAQAANRPASSPLAPTPAREATPARGEPQLNAISRQDGQPVAVIDGHLVHEGESVGDVRVVRIGDTEVEVEIRGVRRTLRF